MRLLLLMPLMLCSACVSASQPALCSATANDRDALASALAADGGPRSLVAGQHLIAKVDAGCS